MERYFAFGANLSPSTLRRRRVRTRGARPARLPGHELVFAVRGVPLLEPAFATVRPADDEVWGVLYDLDEAELARLRSYEGLSYREVGVEVETERGPEAARTFVAKRPCPPRPPSARYLGLLVAGARHHGLPDAWLARLEAQPSRHVPVLHELVGAGFALVDHVHRAFTRPSERR
ncbi:MAG: gamma-glutamylcyclotransferase [Polyangiaceae bacterium]|nr:gamma-glutamylcyclotransferase [Polyangiaceae bacterium]